MESGRTTLPQSAAKAAPALNWRALEPRSPKPVIDLLDGAIFVATLCLTILAMITVAVVTPLVVLISAAMDRFDPKATGSGWTAEKVSERA